MGASSRIELSASVLLAMDMMREVLRLERGPDVRLYAVGIDLKRWYGARPIEPERVIGVEVCIVRDIPGIDLEFLCTVRRRIGEVEWVPVMVEMRTIVARRYGKGPMAVYRWREGTAVNAPHKCP